MEKYEGNKSRTPPRLERYRVLLRLHTMVGREFFGIGLECGETLMSFSKSVLWLSVDGPASRA
jgi:hypothetical protein